MSYSIARRALAAVCFLAALATYLLSLAPTIGFWRSPELAAAAWWLQIPQPIVGPLWLILARATQTVAPGSAALGAGFLSAFASAMSAAFVALIVTRLVDRWRSRDTVGDEIDTAPALVGGLIAALVFAWSDTQWSVSLVGSIEPVGTLLALVALYATLVWDAEVGARGAARWLLLAAYCLGLVAGLDSRFLLIAPAVALILFNRRFAPTASTVAALLVLLTAGWYLFVDGLLREWIPALIDGRDLLTIVGVPLLVVAAWVVIRTQARPGVLTLGMLSCAVGLLGATTIAYLPIRNAAHPPINAMDLRTSEPTALYLRLSGGDTKLPLWPRRVTTAPESEASAGLLSELRYLFGYQATNEFLRYLLWNYVGREDDLAGARASFWSDPEPREMKSAPSGDDPFPVHFFALPLLLAMLGLAFHLRYDPRMALAMTFAFVLLGFGVVVVANLQEPEIRDRDYLFVGAFMVVAIWSGLGAAGLAALQREGDVSGRGLIAPAVGLLCLLAVPIPMLLGGWTHHQRSTDWVAWDYAYNLLQSCEQDAILFTAGDNDTFPVLYLQSVDGVRRDVRVINLAMANDLSYLDRVRSEPAWGRPPVPLGIPDSILGDTLVRVAMPEMVTLQTGDRKKSGRGDTAAAMRWVLRGPAVGEEGLQMIRLQERVIVDVLARNAWRRPVYFSSGVPQTDRAGLDEHLIRSGLALRVLPERPEPVVGRVPIDADRMRRALIGRARGDRIDTAVAPSFVLRGLGPGGGYLPPEARQVVAGYRVLYLLLAEHELAVSANAQAARAVLDEMERTLPSERHPMPYWMHATLATLSERTGDRDAAGRHARIAIEQVNALGERWNRHPQAAAYHPIETKVRMLAFVGEYDEGIRTFEQLRRAFPRDHHLRAQIEELRVERHLSRRDTAAALRELDAIIAGYSGIEEPALRNNAAAFEAVRDELMGD